MYGEKRIISLTSAMLGVLYSIWIILSSKNGKDWQRERQAVIFIKITWYWASLVAQWLRICLPVQGTWVRALVWEDPTCRGATGPVSHNY